jgi:outer membrane protein assembly factor BamD (BamD/ComL family)
MRLGNYLSIVMVTITSMAAASCLSGPVNIPEELTAPEMIQQAQEASDRNRYQVSLQYYEAILERFPGDLENVCAAEYEIALIYYKQKKYDESKAGFTSLLSRYEGRDGELLPPQFRILAEKIMGTIAEKENKRTKVSGGI